MLLKIMMLCAIVFASSTSYSKDSSVNYQEHGVYSGKIIFGQTAATGGPASALGTGMRKGILAAFNEVNKLGGIGGKKLELITYDDGYEPLQAIDNVKELIDDDVFALIGGVGTPTANAIEPITSKAKVPFIAPFTGAEFLRSPFKRYVINIRGSYWQETEEWVERLTKDLGVKRIAILYQDDSYGRAGLSGVKKALEKRGLSLVAEGAYRRNTTAVKAAALSIRKAKPEAILMVGAYKPCAEFIKIAKRLKLESLFINISFVGSKALAKELGEQGEGVIISQVVPFPFDNAIPLVKSYQNALISYDKNSSFGFVSMEGYMAGRFVVEILKNLGGKITREAFLDKVYSMRNVDLDGTKLTYGDNDNQGLDKVFLTILQKDGSFVSVDKLN